MTVFSQTFNLTASSAPTIPPALAANGLSSWKLAFFDDFTSNTICPNLQTSLQAGYNWYWDQCINSTNDYSVSPSLTAATIPATLTIAGNVVHQGNSGGGSNASPAGGILTLLQQPGVGSNGSPNTPANWSNPYNGCLASVPYNSNNQAGFAGGPGTWNHSYIEAYLQYNCTIDSVVPAGANAANVGSFAPWGWPAWWCTGANSGSGNYCEIDFLEYFGSNMFGGPGTRQTTWATSTHDWTAGVGEVDGLGTSGPGLDSNWHTYGMLWTSTGSGTGQVKFYLDQVLYWTLPTGTGTSSGCAFLEANPHQVLRLGSGNQLPLNVDWVRVFNASGLQQ